MIDMRKYGVSGPYTTMASRVTIFGAAIAITAALQECEANAPATITRRMPAAMKLLNVLTAVPRAEARAISLK